jgi:FkbM family methyltransferase
VVNRVLSHVEIITHKKYVRFLDIFTEKEKQEIQLLRKDFRERIIKVSADCWLYKKYFLPINWFEPCVFYAEYGLRNLKTLNKLKNKKIIDAGAFIGDSAIVLRQYTNKKVYAFEPVSENYATMLKTLKMNDCLDTVVPVHCGLGDKREKKFISIEVSGSSFYDIGSPVNKKRCNKEEIKIITLDDYVQENNIAVGLIKTDLEGAEQDFLRGAERTIRNQKPILLISIYHTASDFFKIKPLLESWNLGYTFSIRRETDGFALLETTLVAEIIP